MRETGKSWGWGTLAILDWIFSLSRSVILSFSILSLSLRLLSFPLSLPSSISPVKVRGDGEGVSKRWSREEEVIRRGKERKIKSKKRV